MKLIKSNIAKEAIEITAEPRQRKYFLRLITFFILFILQFPLHFYIVFSYFFSYLIVYFIRFPFLFFLCALK